MTALFLVIFILIIWYAWPWRTKGSRGWEITEKEYIGEEEGDSISITYPQINGMEDAEKEKRINDLIETDAKKWLVIKQDVYELYGTCLDLDYEVKCLNDRIISIRYKGWNGALVPGKGLYPTLVGSTIDLEEEKVLTLPDIVSDFTTLGDWLFEDRFEGILTWKGGGEEEVRMSREAEQHSIHSGEELAEELMDTELDISNHFIEWYTDGEYLYIISYPLGKYYNEHRMELEQLHGVLEEDFTEKVKQ